MTTSPLLLSPDELEQLLDEVADKMQGVLDSLVIDTVNDHNAQDTARRVAKMYLARGLQGPLSAQRPRSPNFPTPSTRTS